MTPLWRGADIVLGWIFLLVMVGIVYGVVGAMALVILRWLTGWPA